MQQPTTPQIDPELTKAQAIDTLEKALAKLQWAEKCHTKKAALALQCNDKSLAPHPPPLHVQFDVPTPFTPLEHLVEPVLNNSREKCVSQQPHVTAGDKNIGGQNKEHDKKDNGEESGDKEDEEEGEEQPLVSKPASSSKMASRKGKARQSVEEKSSDEEGESEEVEDKMDEGDDNEQGNNKEPMKSQPALPMKQGKQDQVRETKVCSMYAALFYFFLFLVNVSFRPFFSKNK